ncbi:MAG: MerR family transcriptional regulator [Clostridia bacterium]|nr:MerR family transcriptional regulator [Clostridia bacterium]
MKTVKQVSAVSGVSVRALQYYDQIGLLPPTQRTASGYRLYDDAALERLQQILLFRELAFSLTEIKAILDDPAFDRARALDRQITLLTMKKHRLERIIRAAKEMKQRGDLSMSFEAFDRRQIDAYKAEAAARWGRTDEYREYESRAAARSEAETAQITAEFMNLFADFGRLRELDPGDARVQSRVKALQDYITAHFYPCNDAVLASLGQMYAADDAFRQNIDRKGGTGTADFVSRAIELYCGK